MWYTMPIVQCLSAGIDQDDYIIKELSRLAHIIKELSRLAHTCITMFTSVYSYCNSFPTQTENNYLMFI